MTSSGCSLEQIVDENPRALPKPFNGITAAAGTRRPLGDVSNNTGLGGMSKAAVKVGIACVNFI